MLHYIRPNRRWRGCGFPSVLLPGWGAGKGWLDNSPLQERPPQERSLAARPPEKLIVFVKYRWRGSVRVLVLVQRLSWKTYGTSRAT